jgi:hypothetical protein
MVFVLDGLRPDSINPIDTPNPYRLRSEGVSWSNGHSAVPASGSPLPGRKSWRSALAPPDGR